MTQQNSFQDTYDKLRGILSAYEDRMILKENGSDNYYLNTPYTEKYKKELFFGAVQIKKNYVSYHLMPVYMFPDLLTGLSPTLRKRMQGKSCFNFRTIDTDQFRELSDLTQKGFDRLVSESLV